VATAEHGDNDHEALLRRADTAMYRAKTGGRNAVQCWDASQQPRPDSFESSDSTTEPRRLVPASST
jgi:predicted signal transduction protein with EAL and GGDEF domain